ncbi:MAG: hypothetical protein R2827_08830 [Bdellovibrionales bacterium]
MDKNESNAEESSVDSGTGASIDDCANVSRGLGVMLDIEDPMGDEAYELKFPLQGWIGYSCDKLGTLKKR